VLWHAYSQRLQMAVLAGIAAYNILPAKLQDAIPPWFAMAFVAVLLTLGIVSRLIAQPELTNPDPDEVKPE